MRGADIRNLEDLRRNFDLNAAIDYFKSGELLTWLEARYYDDEADAISKIGVGDDLAAQKICAALGVEFNDNPARLNEKISRLRQLTADEKIIANAAVTALNQEDLADLLDRGARTIYLCGENFSVPIRVRDKNYVGILSTPTIKIRANSQADLDAQNIRFENVRLPFRTVERNSPPIAASENSRRDELAEMFEVIFGTRNVWAIIDEQGRLSANEPSPAQKKMFIKMICGDDCNERDIIYLRAAADFSEGWALTTDALCVGGKIKFQCCDAQTDDVEFQAELNRNIAQAKRIGRKKIFYSDISETMFGDSDEPEISGGIMEELGFGGFGNDFAAPGTFFRTTTGRMIIFDRDGVPWNIFCDKKIPPMTINFFNAGNPNEISVSKLEVFDDEQESKLGKFLEFAKS